MTPSLGNDYISLAQKQVPLAELDASITSQYDIAVERQQNIDISGLKERIENEGPTMWDPAYQKGNVPIRRAGHDKWGIGKAVFIFSDDYIDNVYIFPWFHTWKKELEAIFDQVQIPVDRVIRCILAKMPPDSDIPTHHDTGAWVSKSHRMHIPIRTDPSIEFKVGVNEEKMKPFEFKEGNLYELNNACKHSVHNYWDKDRVHLIFDFVEEDFPLNKVELTPDMQVHQTRRTLDLSTDYGKRIPPSFLLIGAQKAGTTSLYDYITQHDIVAPAKRKETHYFDWRWNFSLPSSDTEEGAKAHLDYYHNFFEKEILYKCPSVLSGEATPSYLLGGSVVIQRVKNVLTHKPKILVILRNPVDRAYSHYSMTADEKGTPAQLKNRGHDQLNGRSFEQVVDEEIDMLKKKGTHPDMAFDNFDSKILEEAAKLKHGGHSFVTRGLYALQLAGWIQAFGKENVMVLSMDDIKGDSLQRTMNDVFVFLGIPSQRISDGSAKNTRQYEPVHDAVRQKLRAFYAPYNEKLYELVGRNFNW